MAKDFDTVTLKFNTPVEPVMVRVERDTPVVMPDGSVVVVRAGTLLPSYVPKHGVVSTRVEPCARCGGSGWIDGKDYMDGSFSTDRPCPKCSGIVITD